MGYLKSTVSVFLVLILSMTCTGKNINQNVPDNIENKNSVIERFEFPEGLLNALEKSNLPQGIVLNILSGIESGSSFLDDLSAITQDDPYLWILVDKEHSLPSDYEPSDLLVLKNGTYRINRNDLKLRSIAEAALEEMAAEARNDGITLLASSAYRAFMYQAELYDRNVKILGQKQADRESARPGHSQHQLGLVIDFGSITDDFALTAEGIWLSENASRFGWSLSYPQGYEDVTGYQWECWHYRYTGTLLADFIDNYFEGIQQYALRFIHEWKLITE